VVRVSREFAVQNELTLVSSRCLVYPRVFGTTFDRDRRLVLASRPML
jgi:hypothetical protein